ncbi:PP2C family protein-serine/threonine phosphatase [Pseudonocardia cypriaca]|nr:PP2C family protein-serine/threonine phosphatase [Pseudonocardia cypriaca]
MVRRSEDLEVGRQQRAGPASGVLGAPLPPVAPLPEPRPSLAEMLLDGVDTAVLACDERGLVRTANAAARRMLPQVRVDELLPVRELTRHGPAEVELEAGSQALVARRQDLPDGWTAWHLREVSEQRARVDALLAERARSRFLAAASSRLGLSLHPGRTARAVVELVAAELADAAVVVLPVRTGAVEWYRHERGGVVASGRLSARGLPEPVAAALSGLAPGPEPLLVTRLTGAPWGQDDRRGSQSAAVRALPGNGMPAGALVLLRDAGSPDDPDAALVDEFAQRAGIALAAAALYAQQTRTTAVLKRNLLEPDLPAVDGMVFGASYRPAEEALLIGGDFFDVHVGADGDEAMFLLGDVCGKGVDAAVESGRLRQAVQALRRLERDPVRLLELLNESMLDAAPPDAGPRFATLVLGTAAPLPGGGLRVRLAAGGHPPPMVVRAGGVEPVEIPGMLVGGVREAHFATRTVDLGPGEACVLYTDGVTEARGGVDGDEEFGEDRVLRLLHGCHVLPAPGIAERVALHATAWRTTGRDDIAVLVVQAPLSVAPASRHAHTAQPNPEEQTA